MAASSHPPGRSIGRLVALAIIGGLCGAAAHSVLRAKGIAPPALSSSAGADRPPHSKREGDSAVRRIRRERDQKQESLHFSTTQWEKLMEKPDLLMLKAGDCYQSAHAGVVPGGETEPPVGNRGPYLIWHRSFFSWDKEKRGQVMEAYYQFGKAVRECQARHVRVSYAGDGNARIDFGDAGDELDRYLKKLSADLRDILGPEEAARLTAVTPISRQWDPIEVTVDFQGDTWGIVTMTDGERGGSWTPGSKITDRPKPGGNLEGTLNRDWVDWKRLFNEAEEKGEGR